jgi:hypothetical protein
VISFYAGSQALGCNNDGQPQKPKGGIASFFNNKAALADIAVADMFFDNAIAFNVADSDSFAVAMKAVGIAGQSYHPFKREKLSNLLVKRNMDTIAEVSKVADCCQ